jgi:hypothetical protein
MFIQKARSIASHYLGRIGTLVSHYSCYTHVHFPYRESGNFIKVQNLHIAAITLIESPWALDTVRYASPPKR